MSLPVSLSVLLPVLPVLQLLLQLHVAVTVVYRLERPTRVPSGWDARERENLLLSS
jgi:hypothetical protein